MNESDASRGVEDILAEYVDRLNSGERVLPDEVLFDHPTCGAEIIEKLENFLHAGAPPAATLSKEILGTVGDYSLRREIGHGGMGAVYDAWQNSLGRRVALKVLPMGVAADARSSTRFLREAQIAGRLGHPGIVQVYASGVDGHTPYYAMEFVEGETLARVLERIREADSGAETSFGGKDSVRYFFDLAKSFAYVAEGLQHAHQRGVIHRDIKPSNLILDGQGMLRILDFGLARLEGLETLTLSGELMGTPLYMSPEQARRKQVPVDHRTDVYSLGATMYEAITGQPPFRGKSHADTLSQIIELDPVEPRKRNPRVPKNLETIVLKCLRKDSDDRYGTAEALAQDLLRFSRGDLVEARPQSKWDRLAQRIRRRRTGLLVVTAFLLLGAVAAWLGYAGKQAEHDRRIAVYRPRVLGAVVKLASGAFSLRPGSKSANASIPALATGVLAPLAEDDARELVAERGFQPVREAAGSLEALAESLPEKLDAHFHLARAYLLLGRWDDARDELNRTLEIDPDFLPAAVLRGELGPGTAVSPMTEPAPRWRPPRKDASAWGRSWHLARVAARRKDWPAVAAAYEHLIEDAEAGDEPYIGFLIEAYLALGAARLEIGQYDYARHAIIAARTLAPTSLEARLLLGRAYELEGREDLARRTFERLLDKPPRPRDETALLIVALYISLKQYEEALRWARELQVSSFKERVLAYLLLRTGDWTGAREAGERAVAADPNPTTNYLLGIALKCVLAEEAVPDQDLALRLLQVADRAGETEFPVSLRRVGEAMAYRYVKATSARHSMNARQTLPAALLSAALAFSARPFGRPGDICDDFADGNIWDGDPVPWKDVWPDRTEYVLVPAGLEIRVFGPRDAALAAFDVLTGDVSVRVSGSFNGTNREASPAGIFAELSAFVHGDLTPLTRGYTGGVTINGVVRILEFAHDEYSVTAETALDFDPYLDGSGKPVDLEIELAATELPGPRVRLDLWVWKRSKEKPDAPNLSWSDADKPYSTGYAGLSMWMHSGKPLCVQSICIGTGPALAFRRGDCNDDGEVNISDAVCILNWLFLGGNTPVCIAVTNTNGDAGEDISDATYLLNHLFLGGPAPAH